MSEEILEQQSEELEEEQQAVAESSDEEIQEKAQVKEDEGEEEESDEADAEEVVKDEEGDDKAEAEVKEESKQRRLTEKEMVSYITKRVAKRISELAKKK